MTTRTTLDGERHVCRVDSTSLEEHALRAATCMVAPGRTSARARPLPGHVTMVQRRTLIEPQQAFPSRP